MNLVKKLAKVPLKFNSEKTKMFYKKLKSNIAKFELLFIRKTSLISYCVNVSKAPGMDEISSKFLKDGAEVLTKPICDIINLSIKFSTFPDKCKIAKLIPLFKKGLKTDPKNYRPISLLPNLSKSIEKAMHTQTQECLDKYTLLYKFQSGFRKSFSTDSCLVQLSDYIVNGMDKGLQKPFDTLDHDVLFEKIECMGFKKPVIKWFKSYLSNINLFVLLEGVFWKKV